MCKHITDLVTGLIALIVLILLFGALISNPGDNEKQIRKLQQTSKQLRAEVQAENAANPPRR